jgi:ATP-dependent DNA helicase PIF1
MSSFRQTQIVSQELLNSNIEEMLKEHLGDIDLEKDLNLSKKQKDAYDLFKNEQNILILGPAGTGKSKVIKTMEEYIKNKKQEKKMILCATTGIAAYNIGGMTIYSFMGIGTGEGDVDYLVKKIIRKKGQADRIRKTDVLVIDEISMMSAAVFEKIEEICRRVRKNSKYFGGIQVILTGDFLQLLPVMKQNKEIYKETDERMIIESNVFNEIFKKDKNVIILEENFRQKQDSKYSEILNRIRLGEHTEDDIKLLNTRNMAKNKQLKPKNDIIQLVSSNKKAKDINVKELNNEGFIYKAKYKVSGKDETVLDLLMKELQLQFKQKEIDEIVLCKNNRVMLIKNLDVGLGLVNGSIGTIKRFVQNVQTKEMEPEVLFDNKITKLITKTEWELDMNGNRVIALQIPLTLAYSITIHKSQSLTLDSAILDLEDCFTYHMVYVSLSRVKSLEGLYLKSFDPKKILVNEKMKEFNSKITK